jgi:hypothetical protein
MNVDPTVTLAWVRRALLSCLRAKDPETLRAGVRQVLKALCRRRTK